MAYPLFQSYTQFLSDIGFQDVVLPFFLLFTVIFAVMQKTKPLGKRKEVNVIFSLVVSLIAIIPHVTGTYKNYDVVAAINSAIPQVSYWVVLGVMFLVLLATFGISFNVEGTNADKGLRNLIIWCSLIIVFLIFAQSANWIHWGWLRALLNSIDPNVVALLVIILVFIAVIAFISGPPEDENNKETSWLDYLGELGKSGPRR